MRKRNDKRRDIGREDKTKVGKKTQRGMYVWMYVIREKARQEGKLCCGERYNTVNLMRMGVNDGCGVGVRKGHAIKCIRDERRMGVGTKRQSDGLS